MLSIAATLVFFGYLIWAYRHRPWAVISLLFLLSSFTLRVFGTLYVDLAGPVFAAQLGYDVGGGTCTPFFVASVLVVVALVILMQDRIRVDPRLVGATLFGLRRDLVSDAALVGTVLALLGCYVEMAASGVVPLFMGIDRLEYLDHHAGVFYKTMYNMSFLYSATLGFFFVRGRIRTGRLDRRFLMVEIALLGFFALTGNRYSAFMVSGTFFIMSFGALFFLSHKRIRIPGIIEETAGRRAITTRRNVTIAAAVAMGFIVGLTLHNLYNVRYVDSGNAADAMYQRTLIQPVELYAVTWERLVGGEISDQGLAWDLMFGNPIDPLRNTGIQFLMVNALGEERATEILDQNSQYAGGYPEVFIELFGIQWTVLAILLVALALAVLYQRMLAAVIHGRFFTFFFTVYLLWAVALLYIGGMLNFLLAWTFWVKVGIVLVVSLVEPVLLRVPSLSKPDKLASAPTAA